MEKILLSVIMASAVTANWQSCRPTCTSSECLIAPCDAGSPYLCVSNTAAKGSCSTDQWPLSLQCTSCCDFRSCLLECRTACTAAQCDSCSLPSLTACTSGPAAAQCSNIEGWSPVGGCAACCDASACASGPEPPVTNPAKLTPSPGWTASPTAFPPPTPLPASPPSTPAPSGMCPPCDAVRCSTTSALCTSTIPFLCTSGDADGECLTTAWESTACSACCDYSSCLPPPPAPYPSSPWLLVPPSSNCTSDGELFLGPNPSATPYGGIDVSGLGCRASVSDDCCGVVPRFNWVLAACHKDPLQRTSMACNHTYGNTSVADIYYINSYQWNRDSASWVMDPSSSFQSQTAGDVLNLDALNLTLMTPSDRQDWDLKYGPTTFNQGTNGLGPPAMLFILSARQLNWVAFFALNQIALNRGPGGERFPDNCWSSSAGEFDFLEAPFWAGIDLPSHHLYASITSGTGRCLPVQKMVSSRFSGECSHPNCCQMCSCPVGDICVGNPHLVGFQKMSCIRPNQSVPVGMVAFDVDGDPTACGAYFSAVPGGSQSTSFFANETDSPTTEVIVAAVVDKDGVTVYRWPSTDEGAASSIWPGIRKFSSDTTIQQLPTVPINISPPCTDVDKPCSIHLPSCGNDCVIDSSAGQFGSTQLAGEFAAECARDGLNWWNAFDSTNQSSSMRSNQLAMFVRVPTKPVSLPFKCDSSCAQSVCQSPERCSAKTPYMCTSGDQINTCSEVPSDFPLSGHCTACCTTSSCVVPCESQCASNICATAACNLAVQPYVCNGGPLSGQCSADSTYFPNQPLCHSCCNAKSC